MKAQPKGINSYKFLVGKNIARSSGATAGTVATDLILAQGEVVVVDEGNVILNTTTVATADKIKLMMGRGAGIPMVESKVLTPAELDGYHVKRFASKVNEVAYVGFNGTSGAIDVKNNFLYMIPVSFNTLMMQETSSLYQPMYFTYESDGTATQEKIATNLYKNALAVNSRWTRPVLLIERVNNGTRGAAGSGSTLTFTKGSNIVTGAAATAISNMAIGDYISSGTTATSPVYKVTGIQGNNLIIDTAYQGATVTAVAATGNLRIAVADIADFGIKITGVNQAYALDSRVPSVISFQVGCTDPDTPTNIATAPFLGFGTYELMREQEALSWRAQGLMFNYTEFPPTPVPTDLNSSAIGYSVVSLSWKNVTNSTPDYSHKGIIELGAEISAIGTPSTMATNNYGAVTSALDVIDAFAVTHGFASQVANR